MADEDPTAEIQAIMDKAGLTSANLLQGGTSMTVLVTRVRTKLTGEFKLYLERKGK